MNTYQARRSKFISTLVSLLFLYVNAYAQSGTDSISGTVRDHNGDPLPQVKISNSIKNSSAISSPDGKYIIYAADRDILAFSCSGYYDQEVQIAGKRKIDVRLSKDYLNTSNSLNMLYGKKQLDNIIAAVSTIGTNQLTSTPSSQILQALPGRLAGLNISLTSGFLPSDSSGFLATLRGRGQTVLIDGVQRSFTSLDPEEIESVSVLKDALSTVMFGQRSSNGILLITTRKGRTGPPRISFTAQTAVQQPLKLPSALPSAQYALLYNEALRNDGIAPKYTQSDINAYSDGSDPYGHPNVDWYSTVLDKTASLSRYNFNVDGSGDRVQYFVSLDHLRDNGLFTTSDVNSYNTNAQISRYLVRSNVGINVTNSTKLNLNLFGRIQQNNQPGDNNTRGIFTRMLSTPSNAYPVFNMDGTLSGTSDFRDNLYGQAVNSGYSINDFRDIALDIEARQKLDFFTKGLWFSAAASYNNSGNYKTLRNKSFSVYNGGSGTVPLVIGGDQANSGSANDRMRVTYLKATMGFDRNMGNHNINALVIADRQSTILNGLLPEMYSNFASNIGYNYKKRYLAEYAASYAGYNRFAPGSRYGFFQAGGIGWVISEETIIKNNFKWLNRLKLRASYGKTGQANTGYYQYIQQWSVNSGDYWFGNGSLERASNELSLVNPNVTWEKANKLNIGMDISIFREKLNLTVDYYNNRFYDLMQTTGRNISIIGNTFPLENIGIQRYYGTDWTLTYQNRTKNFNYYISTNLSVVQSKMIFNDEVDQLYSYQVTTGKPVDAIIGYAAIGLFQNQAEIDNTGTAIFGARSSIRPGDIRYEDKNGDGKIDFNDSGVIGKLSPKLFLGTTLGFNYKGIDFNVLFQASINRQVNTGGNLSWAFRNGNGNAFEYNLNRWTPTNTVNATSPRLWIGTNSNNELPSTYWIRNSDFIRIKNIEIGYTLPSEISSKLKIPSIRLFFNGLNLYTFSPLNDLRDDIDPEAFDASYPIQRTLNFGVNIKL